MFSDSTVWLLLLFLFLQPPRTHTVVWEWDLCILLSTRSRYVKAELRPCSNVCKLCVYRKSQGHIEGQVEKHREQQKKNYNSYERETAEKKPLNFLIWFVLAAANKSVFNYVCAMQKLRNIE